jgi:hypothetical protein
VKPRLVVRRAVVGGGVATIGAAVALFVTSGMSRTVLDVYLLAIGGVLLLALYRIAHMLGAERPRSAFDRALARMAADPPRAPSLALERDIELSSLNSFHHYVRMRPVLRQITAHRLRSHFGIDLDREPERARELVPSRAWEIIRPDCPPPRDRLAPGPSVADQGAVLDELERL